MATANIQWTPSSSSSTDQTIMYRVLGDTDWITFATVGSLIDSASIPGLDNNKIYEFRVVNNCAGGGGSPGPVQTKIYLACPIITKTLNAETIDYSFPNLGGDVSKYQMDLLDAGLGVVGFNIHTAPFEANIAGSLTNLTPNTNYHLRLTIWAGSSFQFSTTCGLQSASTTPPQTCSPPTGVTVTMGA